MQQPQTNVLTEIVRLAQFLDVADLRSLENVLGLRRLKLQDINDKKFAGLLTC